MLLYKLNSHRDKEMDALYKNIKKLRIEKKLKQKDLADLIGYSANTMIAHIEHGEVDLSYSKIKMLAEIFDVSVPELLGYASTDFTKNYTHLSEAGKTFMNEALDFAIYKYGTEKPASKRTPSKDKKH